MKELPLFYRLSDVMRYSKEDHNCLDHAESFTHKIPTSNNDMIIDKGFACSICGDCIEIDFKPN